MLITFPICWPIKFNDHITRLEAKIANHVCYVHPKETFVPPFQRWIKQISAEYKRVCFKARAVHHNTLSPKLFINGLSFRHS